MANENGGTFNHKCHKYEIAGKVHYTSYGTKKYSYVIDECIHHLEVRRPDNVIEMVQKMKYNSNKDYLIKHDGDKIVYNKYYIISRLATDEFHFTSVSLICIILLKKKYI